MILSQEHGVVDVESSWAFGRGRAPVTSVMLVMFVKTLRVGATWEKRRPSRSMATYEDVRRVVVGSVEAQYITKM